MTSSAERFVSSLKRFLKVGKAPVGDVPVNEVRFSKRKGDFVAEFEGHTYPFQGKGSLEKFQEWFTDYTPSAPRCASCQEIIFPQETVGEENGSLVHLRSGCCVSGGSFVGQIGKDGKVILAFPDGASAAEQALKSRKMILVNGLNTSHPVIEERPAIKLD